MGTTYSIAYVAGQTVLGTIRDQDGNVYYPTGEAMETWGTLSHDIADYGIATVDKGGGIHLLTIPTALSAGWYYFVAYDDTITQPVDRSELVYWDGTTLIYPTPVFGMGDHANTVTIKTTDSDLLTGVTVWLNTEDNRESSVANYFTTGMSGEATFYLTDDVTYYVFCSKRGYSFAAETITPTSSNRTHTLAIGSATTASVVSAYATSFLTRAIADVRKNVDEPTYDAKYSDDEIITKLEQAYSQIYGEITRNSSRQIVARYQITLVSGQTRYPLPPTSSMIYSVYQENSNTGLKCFYDSRSRFNPMGRGIWLEGDMLCIQNTDIAGSGRTLTIEYVVDGTAMLHNGTCSISADGTEITFGSTPYQGTLDTRLNAYAGCMYRNLSTSGDGATGNVIQERTISNYDNATRVATLSTALSPVPTAPSGNIYYEVSPSIHKGLDIVAAVKAASIIAAIEGNNKKASLLEAVAKRQTRNLNLTAYYSNMTEAIGQRMDTYRNPRFMRT